jgi:hypothetical protein
MGAAALPAELGMGAADLWGLCRSAFGALRVSFASKDAVLALRDYRT